MKAKMTGYQDGGKMPADSKKQELAKKLFGTIPKFNKEEARYGMMAEKIKKLQKEYDYWTNKKQPTTASGVKVQMDKIREDMKKYAGGGKMDMYSKGGKMKKYLMGGQVKLDKNKDGKISAIDFKMLKKK
jgi:hypothetical protein